MEAVNKHQNPLQDPLNNKIDDYFKYTPELEEIPLSDINNLLPCPKETQKTAYKIHWKIAIPLLCAGIIPGLVYLMGVGVANYMGGRKIERKNEEPFESRNIHFQSWANPLETSRQSWLGLLLS